MQRVNDNLFASIPGLDLANEWVYEAIKVWRQLTVLWLQTSLEQASHWKLFKNPEDAKSHLNLFLNLLLNKTKKVNLDGGRKSRLLTAALYGVRLLSAPITSPDRRHRRQIHVVIFPREVAGSEQYGVHGQI